MSEGKKKQQDNLIPFNKRTENEQREIAKKGGKASVKKRREQKKLKDIFNTILESKVTDKKSIELIKEIGIDDIDSYKKLLAFTTLKKAIEGDMRAVELVQSTIGETPKEDNADKEVLDKLDELLKAQGVDNANLEQ